MLLSLNNDMPMANDKYENGNKNKKEFLNNQNKVKGKIKLIFFVLRGV